MNPFDQLAANELAAAAATRVSERAYADRPVEQDKIEQLRACIEAVNTAEPCLDFQLYGPLDDAGKAVGITARLRHLLRHHLPYRQANHRGLSAPDRCMKSGQMPRLWACV